MENFLFISTEVIAFGNKLHPTNLRTLREVLYLLK